MRLFRAWTPLFRCATLFRESKAIAKAGTVSPALNKLTPDGKKLRAFTSPNLKREGTDKVVKVRCSRAWRANELRLKATEELHKLWYVLLKEKNAIISDIQLHYRVRGNKPRQSKLMKVRQSMARLLTVLNERKNLREEYRRKLEDEYIDMKRKAELEEYKSTVFEINHRKART